MLAKAALGVALWSALVVIATNAFDIWNFEDVDDPGFAWMGTVMLIGGVWIVGALLVAAVVVLRAERGTQKSPGDPRVEGNRG